METEQKIETREVDRTAKLTLLRVTDYEALAAAAPDGKISLEDLQNGGTFAIRVEPNGRDAKPTRVEVNNAEAGRAWLEGFEYAVALKKKGPRKPKPNGSSAKGKGKSTTKRATK